jgi:Icc protein
MKIIQLTDCHLFSDPNEILRGENCCETLTKVLKEVRSQIAPDDILAFTGDLADSAEPAAYAHFKKLVSDIPNLKLILPGNHDDPQVLLRELGDIPHNRCGAGILEHADCVIVTLDSTIAGEIHGALGDSQLHLINEAVAVARASHKPVLILVHHQTLPVDGYMDRYSIRNADALLKTLDDCPEVRAVVCGHIHQEFDEMRGHVRFIGSPSTCYQIQVGTNPTEEEDIVDVGNRSGYRTLWFDGDRVETAVHRI